MERLEILALAQSYYERTPENYFIKRNAWVEGFEYHRTHFGETPKYLRLDLNTEEFIQKWAGQLNDATKAEFRNNLMSIKPTTDNVKMENKDLNDTVDVLRLNYINMREHNNALERAIISLESEKDAEKKSYTTKIESLEVENERLHEVLDLLEMKRRWNNKLYGGFPFTLRHFA